MTNQIPTVLAVHCAVTRDYLPYGEVKQTWSVWAQGRMLARAETTKDFFVYDAMFYSIDGWYGRHY